MSLFARARFDLQEFWSEVRSAYLSMKAARHHGKAVRLDAAGRHAEAFESTTRALASLPEPSDRPDFTAPARIGIAVLHAQLGTRLGRPELAEPEVRKALQGWGKASEAHPLIRERLSWLGAWLRESDK